MMLRSFRFQIRRGSRQSSAVTRWLAQRPRKSNERRLRLSYCLEKRERSSRAPLNNCGLSISDFGLRIADEQLNNFDCRYRNLLWQSELQIGLFNPQSAIRKSEIRN